MPTDPKPSTGSKPRLRSEFAGDPDMVEIIQMFVQEMPQRVDQMVGSWERHDAELLGRIAHQLKGASGGYGFPPLGFAAAALEAGLKKLPRTATQAELEGLRLQFDELLELCRRVSVE